MPTENRRIATYISKEIDEKFQAYKVEKGYGDSKALISILEQFLEVSYKVSQDSSLLFDIKTELKSELLKELDNKIGELRSELNSESISIPVAEFAREPASQQELSIPALETTSFSTEAKGLSGRKLGKMLNCDHSGLGKKARDLTKKEFASFTKEKDPRGIAWEQREDKKYYPLLTTLVD